jgi:23S rRNA G2445 N2-methylase RlmL
MLVRTSPRPLSARAWRVCDFPGALDATVAYAMVQIASPSSSDRFANLFCGSGTLMIERMLIGSTVVCVGVDDSAPTLDCALANLSASGAAGKAALVRASARRTPFPDNTFNTLVADLPFGMNIPTDDIAPLYADAMNEATRISAPGASFVFITTRNRLVESLIEENTDTWSPVGALPIAIPHRRGFIHPVIYHLRRRK